MRPQRQLAGKIEAAAAPPQRAASRRARLGHAPRPRAAAAPPRLRGSAGAAPRACRGRPCAGSRGAPPRRRAQPPAPRGRARREPQRQRDLVGRARPFQPVEEPQPPLRKRQRNLGRTRHGDASAGRAACAVVQTLGQRRHGRGLEQRCGSAISTSSVARIRLISRVASSEWPPSSKKLSSMPTRSSPSTSANSAHRISSCGVRGARAVPPASDPGAGSARRSSLPFGGQRQPSSTTNAAGTM